MTNLRASHAECLAELRTRVGHHSSMMAVSAGAAATTEAQPLMLRLSLRGGGAVSYRAPVLRSRIGQRPRRWRGAARARPKQVRCAGAVASNRRRGARQPRAQWGRRKRHKVGRGVSAAHVACAEAGGSGNHASALERAHGGGVVSNVSNAACACRALGCVVSQAPLPVARVSAATAAPGAVRMIRTSKPAGGGIN